MSGWSPEDTARYVAEALARIPTIEDDYERWGLEWQVATIQDEQRRRCGTRWPEEETT